MGRIFLLVTLLVLSASLWCVAQGAKDNTAPTVISLTDAEKTQLDLNQSKQDNLNLRIQLVQSQIAQQQQALADETAKLRDRLYKAHNLDQAKWTLNPDGKFVAIAPPPAPKLTDKPAK